MNPNMMKYRRIGGIESAPAVSKKDVTHNLADMPWKELTALGRKKGVFKVGMKRAAVEAAIADVAASS